ncbi:flagellar assembly protein T N-terminal domain-containing protein [Marinobacterium iners]|uniref:Flagellar assembly protein T, N-terminal domain n=1 Tax=Marinobacterium iners DSM 11526 TaxID=1122198 RepID=A0A1H4EYG4_9GAMM|nr:flagellar assembly protein T N-terminal domain-containing protein [Marinobacterium iners]SEA89302.1 Flagellar assembly protein T, N-terminal domain [Marinobacterium iners DSM 11526]
MLTRLCRLLLLCLTLAIPHVAAITIEAEGSAPIINNDLDRARELAVSRAREQASLQGSAWISTTQEVRDGILEIDNMRINSLTQLNNIRIIDEYIRGSQLTVRILAEVEAEAGCANGQPPLAYRKTIAIGGFSLARPADASHGNLQGIQQGLATIISQSLQQSTLNVIDRGNLQLMGNQDQPPQQLSEGALSRHLNHAQQQQTQFLVTGIIRDLSLHNPAGPRPPNILLDTYRRLDFASSKHLRNFVLDLYIFDTFTGQMMWQQPFATAGRWNRPVHEKTGFGSPLFWQQDFGQKVEATLQEISRYIDETLMCEPFRSSITRTEGNEAWIGAGSLAGLKPGDRLSVYRLYTHYDANQMPVSELRNTRQTLTLEDVQPTMSRGRLPADSNTLNIQQDDIVIAH